jgi:hypothetical protein
MKIKTALPYLHLLTSTSTLLCCALPSLLVGLGMGAVVAGFAPKIPGLIWLSENKIPLFIIGAILLSFSAISVWRARNLPCPIDPQLAKSCDRSRRFAKIGLIISGAIYLIGIFFAFIAPRLMN